MNDMCIATFSQDNGFDGGEGGPLQEEHGDDLNYKMVLVVAMCKTDIASLASFCLHSEDAEHTSTVTSACTQRMWRTLPTQPE